MSPSRSSNATDKDTSTDVDSETHSRSLHDSPNSYEDSAGGFEVPLTDSPNRTPLSSLPISLSRDEMNLAEFPLTVLSKRVDPNIKTLEFTDTIRGKNSDVVERKWIITGADKFGLPTSSDDEVLLGLLKLTADDGLRNRKIYFTRYELLRVLRWTTEGRSYSRLQNALDRLSGVRIKATNAFYDNETKLHSTRNFGIIDAYEINDGRDTRPSFFTWSDVLFKSFQVGFIKKLDLDFYLNLRSAVSKRLYRYLDKHFWYKSRVQMNLFTLAHEKVGISRNFAYASSLKQQLEPAIEELISNKMLSSYEYVGKGRATELVLYAARPARKLQQEGQPQASERTVVPAPTGETDEGVLSLLVIRGINESQARRLIEAQNTQGLDRIKRIVGYYDSLVQMKSKLVSRNPQGFLYRAAENPFAFVLPEERNKTSNAAASTGQSRTQPPLQFKSSEKDSQKDERGVNRDQPAETEYLIQRRQELVRMRNETPPAELARITEAVEAALSRIRPLISESRFSEAVQHGVEQKLLKMSSFPDFDAWKNTKRT